MSFRVATYNIHKCKGMDGRVNVSRIAHVIDALDVDVIGLQECLLGQARDFAERLGEYELHFGETRLLNGLPYGNATLSRLPVRKTVRYEITHGQREARGVLRTDLEADEQMVCFMNLHLGTSYLERKVQADKLLSEDLLEDPAILKPRILAGDFNEWTRGKCSRMMELRFNCVDVRDAGRRRTYPGMMPVLTLDHIYFDRLLRLKQFRVVRSKESLMASDHLPMVAEFEFGGGTPSHTSHTGVKKRHPS